MKNKKGFTVVELVIVIAIIAILAAVLIPTFSTIIKKANVSKDQQLIRNLNTALISDKATSGKHPTMQSALDAAEAFGYDVGKINKSATDNEILWDSANDVFCYYNADKGIVEYIPETNVTTVLTSDSNKYWALVRNTSATVSCGKEGKNWSVYLASNDQAVLAVNGIGIDVGNCEDITEINYTHTITSDHDVVIRTNSILTKLTVDAASDNVRHYGYLGHALISAVSSDSYYEYGYTLLVEIATGRIVITNAEGASIGTIYLDKKDDYSYDNIILAIMDGGVLPEIIYRDEISLNGVDRVLIATVQQVNEKGEVIDPSKTELIYFYGVQNSHEKDKEDANVSPLGSLLLEAASGTYARNNAVASSAKDALIQSIIAVQVEVTNTAANTVKTMSLAKFRNEWNTGVYASGDTTVKVLVNFSLAGSNWTPIGTFAQPFYGTFDGNGKTISGLTFSGTAQYCGLIGVAGSHDVEVKDLTLDEVSISNTYNSGTDIYTGAVIGFVKQDAINLTLTSINVGGSVSSIKHTGGIVGTAYNTGTTLVDGCNTSCAISAGNGGLASMIGYAYYFNSLTVKDCTTSSNLTFTGGSESKLFLGDFISFTPNLSTELENISRVHFTGTNTWSDGASITISPTIKLLITCLKVADYTLGSGLTVVGSSDGDSRNIYKLTVDGATINKAFTNLGDLTVKSGTFNGQITNGYAGYTDNNSSVMTIENGSFIAPDNLGSDLLINYGNLTIKDGSFEHKRETASKWCILGMKDSHITLISYSQIKCTETSGKTDIIYCVTDAYYRLGNTSSYTTQNVSGDVNVSSVKKAN